MNRNQRQAKFCESVMRDRARLVQLESEHAAFLAVAEAAEAFDNAVALVVKNQNRLPGEISRNYISAGLKLRSALANLAAVRGESEGGK